MLARLVVGVMRSGCALRRAPPESASDDGDGVPQPRSRRYRKR